MTDWILSLQLLLSYILLAASNKNQHREAAKDARSIKVFFAIFAAPRFVLSQACRGNPPYVLLTEVYVV